MSCSQGLSKLLYNWREAIVCFISRGPEGVTTSRIFGNGVDLKYGVVWRDLLESDTWNLLVIWGLAGGWETKILLGMPAFTRDALWVIREAFVVLAILLRENEHCPWNLKSLCFRAIGLPTSEDITEISSSSLPFSSTAIPRLLLDSACRWSYRWQLSMGSGL